VLQLLLPADTLSPFSPFTSFGVPKVTRKRVKGDEWLQVAKDGKK
jgi:hypothetical protein